MPCKSDIKQAILDKAFDELTDRRNTFSRVSDDTIQVNGVVDNAKTRAQNREQARAIANELLERTKKSFNGYITGYISELSEFDPIKITFTPSQKYIDHEYNSLPDRLKTNNIDTEGELRGQILDNTGINTSYQLSMFEPSMEPEGGVFTKFIALKEGQLKEYQRRLNNIKSAKRTKDLTATELSSLNNQERELNNIIEGNYELGKKGLKEEINELKGKDKAQVQSVGYYVEKDLDRLGKLAYSNNIDDIREGEKLVGFYELAGKFQIGVKNPFFNEDDIFLRDQNGKITSAYKIDDAVRQQYQDWANKAIEYKSELERRSRDILEDTINSNPSVRKTFGDRGFSHSELVNDGKGLKDTDWISMWTMDISHGLNSTNGLIPQVMFSRLNIGTEQKEAWSRELADKVDEMSGDVQKELAKLGHTFKGRGILGLRGVSFNLFKQISKEGNETHDLVQRYTKEYSDNEKKAKSTFYREFDAAKSIPDYKQSQKAINTAFEKLKQWRRANTIIVDSTKLSAIESDPEFATLGAKGDKAYENSLIKILGKQGFEDQVADQKRLLRKYQVDRQGIIDQSVIMNSVNNYDELSDKDKNNIGRWEANHSPLRGYQDYNAVSTFFGDDKANSFMDYNSFVPRRNIATVKADITNNVYHISDTNAETGHYDKNFETIENNPILNKFYNKVKEFCEIVHENMPYDIQQSMGIYTLPGLMKTSAEIINDKNTGILSGLILSFKHLMDRIRTNFGVVKQSEISHAALDPVTGKPNYQVNDGFMRGNAKAINERMVIERTKFIQSYNTTQAKGEKIDDIKKFSVLPLNKFNTGSLLLLADYAHVNISLADIKAGRLDALRAKVGDKVDIGRLIADFSIHSVVQSQSFDLPKLMKYFSDMTMAYAARQEALPILEIMKKHYEGIANPRTNNTGKALYNKPEGEYMKVGLRTNGMKQMDDWFERVALGNYGLKHIGEFGKEGVKQSTRDNIDKQVANIQDQINKATTKEERERLETKKNRLLSDKTVRFAGKTIYSNEERKKVGELQALIDKETDETKRNKLIDIQQSLGKTRTGTALYDNMLNYIRTLRLGYNLSSATTNFLEGVTSNMILGASDEYFDPKELLYGYNTVKHSFLKNLSFGHLETDRAQKNRSLMDKFNVIIDSKNELQRASNKTLGSMFSWLNPHEMNQRVEYINQSPLMIAMLRTMKIKDKSGNESRLWDAYTPEGHLRDEFKTQDNIDNWENLDGADYHTFKAKLNEIIGIGHGHGYDEKRGMMAKSNSLGKASMMFKTWIPSSLYWRFASQQDDINTNTKGFKGRYWSYGAGSGGIHGAAIGAVLFGPIGAAWGYGIGALAGAAGGTSSVGIIRETIEATKQLFLKSLGMPINLLTGRQIVGTGQKAFESWVGKGKFTAQDAKNMKGNMADLSMQLAWLGMILLAKHMFWDDDDKPDDTERQAHNIIVNRLMNLSSQAAMYVNPHDLYGSTVGSMAVVQYLTEVGKEMKKFQNYIDGDDINKSGPNAGQSALAIQSRKTFLPGMFKDTQLGFGSQSKSVYPEESPYHKYFHNSAYIAKQQLKGDRAERRVELMDSDQYKDIKDEDERKKEVNKQINREFPSDKRLTELGETRDDYEKNMVK